MEVCYRHPDRETGVSCSNCGRPICPDCMTSTTVGMRCPECAKQTTKVRTARTLTEEPQLTYVLIAINVLIFLGIQLAGGADAAGGGLDRGSLADDLSMSRNDVADGEFWVILTSGFTHTLLWHLGVNMLALWILGSMLEPAIGRLRFALIYFASLLAGSFGALLLVDNPIRETLGASGAIYGLFGAAFVVMRHRGINPMESGLGLWLILNLVITFTFPGISIGGHLGGLMGGALAALALFELPDRVRRLPPIVPTLVVVAIGAVSVLGAIAVSS
jgi:membrane associated rhomboid family serine protease